MSKDSQEVHADDELNQFFDSVKSFGKSVIDKGQQLKESLTPDREPEEPLRDILARIEQRLDNLEQTVGQMTTKPKTKKAKKKKAKKD
ncbi:MAG: hypothetical protein ACPGVU_05840 [Limisphaerales bacterium]